MKTINLKAIFLGAALALVFSVGASIPAAHAQYYGDGGSPYGTPIVNVYGYNRPQYVPQPVTVPVYYPAPVVQPVYTAPQPVVYNYPVYQGLSVSCSPSNTYVPAGSYVTWTAYATGGNGIYTYSWSGSDGISGYGQTTSYAYSYPGNKTASVTVYSNGQYVTQACGNVVTVYGYPYQTYSAQPVYQTSVYQTPVYQQSNNSGLDIGCYVDPANARVNQPVTWSVEVVGGQAPYTYSWTGTDGLSGSQSTVIKYYATGGTKSAIVSVSSADGKSATRACSGTLTVASGYSTVRKTPAPAAKVTPTPSPTPVNQSQAAAFFSLGSVPWGWVAFLIILVLFFTVIYLLFNRQKI